VPGVERLDFRAEGYWTDLPGLRNTPGTWYFNNHYVSGYTNEGFLLGHPVGREGSGYTLKTTYWFTPQSTLTLGYRHVHVNPEFLQGGSIEDYNARGRWHIRDQLTIEAGVQYEHWRFPLLAPTQQTNVSSTIGIRFEPARWRMK
jgi:hypothetical protein